MKAKLIINIHSGRMGRSIPSVIKWGFQKLILKFKLIYKPRTTSDEIIEAVTKKCEGTGIKLNVEFTKHSKHAIDIARDAKDNYDLIIVAGGDGTINEVINGIANSKATLVIIPFGTCNVLALELGIPINPIEAVQLITEGKKTKIDLGYVETKEGSRYFAILLGVGFEALLLKDATLQFKKRWGFLAYLIIGIKHFTVYKWPKIHVKHKLTSTGYYMIIANCSFICNKYQVANSASVTDGLLDLVLINRKDWWSIIPMLLTPLTGATSKLLPKEYYQIEEAYVYSAHEILVQADGELVGTAPFKVKVAPKVLNVIVKNNVDNDKIY
ncbi:MAG: diacylglycerol kinase family lipid kinase [Candidatus Methanoperedens sp.]|nr:diacylglycerol kinase family lipid kinase [Candidatus Methanoperedens sp.]